jgi:hypothetical protein
MTASEYVAAFASIILALAVTDLATSMHRLLRARKRVRWDWLPLAIALLILLGTVQFWWVFFDIWRSSSRLALGAFLPDFLTLLLLFFVASAALPDEVPEAGLDLKGYYAENRGYFWTLFLLLAVSATASSILHRLTPASSPGEFVRLVLESGNLTLVALSAILLATGRRWVHGALILFMLAALVWQWVALTIAG